MPDLASLREAVTSCTLLPMLDTIPMPVTTTRRISWSFPSGRLENVRLREKPHPQVARRVDRLPVGFQDAVGDAELELAQDDPLQIHHVLDLAHLGDDHACELDLADPQRAALARRSEPAEKKPQELPERVEP